MLLIAERFIAYLINTCMQAFNLNRWGHLVSASLSFFETETPFPYPSFEKSIITERTMQYVKDRTEYCFDDYFPCKRKKCKLKHVRKWLYLFIDQHNREILS